MKRGLTSLLLALVLALGASLSANAAETIKLTMTSLMMDKHPVVSKGMLVWAEEIKQKTGGQVEITYYNPGTICPDPELYNAVKKGQVHIGLQAFSRDVTKIPVGSVLGVANSLTSAVSAGEAFWRLYEETPEFREDFKDMKVLGLMVSVPTQIISTVPIRNSAELQGKKIIVGSGDNARVMRALGANPMIIPPMDIYLSLSRGMAEGTMLPIPTIRSFKVDESAKHVMMQNLIIAPSWICMNLDQWNALPKDVQAVFDELGGHALVMRLARISQSMEDSDRKYLTEQGMTFYDLTPAEREGFVKKAAAVGKENWETAMKNRKLPNQQEIFDKAMKIFAEEEAKYQAGKK